MSTETSNCSSCQDSSCAAKDRRQGEREEAFSERQALAARLCQIDRRIMVLSGKGGVGKSTVAVSLAAALAKSGKRVGLLDIDVHGPSVPKLLRLEHAQVTGTDQALLPVPAESGLGDLRVMSIGFLLPEADAPVIWRGPRKYGLIKQFIKDVEWGQLDYLVVDAPPGTGDEPLAIVQLIDDAVSFSSQQGRGPARDGAVIVTTPQQLSVQDVRRSVMFCRQVKLPVLGVVENMSGYVCPHCGEHTPIFGRDGGKEMAAAMGIPFLGAVPLDPQMVLAGDSGQPLISEQPEAVAAQAFRGIVQQLFEPAAAKPAA